MGEVRDLFDYLVEGSADFEMFTFFLESDLAPAYAGDKVNINKLASALTQIRRTNLIRTD